MTASIVAKNGDYVSPPSVGVSLTLPYASTNAEPDDVFVMPWGGALFRVNPTNGVTTGPLSEVAPFTGPPAFDIDSTNDLGYFISFSSPSRLYTLNLATGYFDSASLQLPANNCRALELQDN